MSYQEKQCIVNMTSGLVITAIFGWEVYQRQMAGVFDLTDDFQRWGILLLIFMGISIVARIVIQIIYHIINAIATRETDEPVKDERDRLINLKSVRNGYVGFSVIMGAAFVSLAIGLPVWGLFIAFIAGGLLSEITENISKLIYYNRGV